MTARCRSICAVALLMLSAFPLQAQKNSGRVSGAVLEAGTHAPVANADVVNFLDGRSVRSDSAGSFSIDRLPAGLVRLMVRAPGYPVATFVVALTEGEHLRRDFTLDTLPAAERAARAQGLPQVTVKTDQSVPARFADFERRRRTGSGHYLTRADIEKGNFQFVTDAMKGLRGVLLDCGGSQGCQVRMSAAPAQCLADWIVDERPDNYFGPRTPIRDNEPIEVYTGPAVTPGEFAGATAGCGLVVIWTRSGPPHRKKPASKP